MANQADAQTDREEADALVLAGNALYYQKNYDGAIEKYKHATELDPNYAKAFYNWGLALAAQKNYDGAIEKNKRVTELDPNHALAFNNWGNVLYAQKQYDGAIEKYTRTSKLDPNYAGAYFNWGNALAAQKKYGEAIDIYREAIQANPNSVESAYAAHNLADLLQRQGKYKESWEAWENARQAYEKNIQTAKNLENADYFQYYAVLSDILGRLTEAEKIYRDGLVYDPHHARIWIGLGNVHLAKMEGDGDESAKEQITRLWWPFSSHESEVHALESDVQKSDNYWNARDAYKKAESILQKQRPGIKDGSLSLQLGKLYLKVEDFTAAELILFEAMNEDKESPQPYADLGVLYSRKGDYARAVQFFEQSIILAKGYR